MPNDAKLGLVMGMTLVLMIGIIFFHREPPASAKSDAARQAQAPVRKTVPTPTPAPPPTPVEAPKIPEADPPMIPLPPPTPKNDDVPPLPAPVIPP